MKRKIIEIDEDKCNGCGACISACAEGALQLVNGKAKLVKEQFCDGFGDCLGECPTGALKIVEMDVPDYDSALTREHVLKSGSADAVRKFDAAAQRHEAHSGGCPGMAMRFKGSTTGGANRPGEPRSKEAARPEASPYHGKLPPQAIRSELEQWPVQIHLVQPGAPFFKNKELVVMSTCGPLASADIHWRFLRGRSVVVGCPKLDDTDGYAEKLGAILSEPTIPKVIVVRMEVPCCGGLTAITRQAVALSGRKDLEFQEVFVNLSGNIAV